MLDHPTVVHGERRGGDLGMGHAAGNAGAAAVLDFIHIVPQEAGAEALGPLVTVVVNLRLGVMVGGIDGSELLTFAFDLLTADIGLHHR
jgi:hypothetical protein